MRVGTDASDMEQVQAVELVEPQGWVVIPIGASILPGKDTEYVILCVSLHFSVLVVDLLRQSPCFPPPLSNVQLSLCAFLTTLYSFPFRLPTICL